MGEKEVERTQDGERKRELQEIEKERVQRQGKSTVGRR